MKLSRNKLIPGLLGLLVLLPILLVFKNIFFRQLPTWGDAPFFYPEALKELFSEPFVWVQRGTTFGGVNLLLWLSPIMFLFGVLNKFFALGSDILVRTLFYIPAIVFAAGGMFFLTQYLKFSKTVSFFAVLFYLFNSYFILLIDGGQVGVVLTYGLFPFILLFGKKLLDKPKRMSFVWFLIASFIMTIADPRVYVIAFITLFILQALDNWRKLWILVLTLVLLIPLNFYWIYPLITIKVSSLSLEVNALQLSSLLNSLLLYAPHWPNNVFGKVVQPPFSFIFLSILVFGSLLLKKRDKNVTIFTLCFLIFAFMAKGTTPPIGGIYNFILNKIPLGFVFRDSTKFFIPLMLFGGVLVGSTIESVSRLINKKLIGYLLQIICYVYLVLLVSPAIFGRLNFVLSNRKPGNDYQLIYNKLKGEGGYLRTAWFPERHPLAFETLEKPVLDARDLVAYRPFASMNASEDVFNFLNNPEFVDWFKVLGIKYLILSGNPRNINPTQKDIENWGIITDLIRESPGLEKVNWGTSFPVYKVPDIRPKIYTVDRLIAVVGPELASISKTLITSIYFEDGKFDPRILEGKSQDSIKLLFNGKDKLDLTMSFLQSFFKSPAENVSSEWAVYGPEEYLKAKYQLLIRGFEYKDFDYGKGLAFSTKMNEKIIYKFNVPKDGDYLLAKRLHNKERQNLSWTIDEINLKKGIFEYEVSNKSGLEVLNVIALIPKDQFEKAKQLAETFVKHFGIVDEKNLKDTGWQGISLVSEGTLKYGFDSPEKGYWLIFTDSYDPLWQLKQGMGYFDSVPVYSLINGFYFEPSWRNLHIEYKGQAVFRWGVWVSAITVLSLTIIYIWLGPYRNERKNSKNISH